MATAAEKLRLLEGVAYIRTHKEDWDQNYWATTKQGHCGTVACLAGHIAITLNPSKPVIPVPWKVWKKPVEKRTHEELQKLHLAVEYQDRLIAVPEDAHNAFDIKVNGETFQVVHVRDRAARLIGNETTVTLKNGEENYLFGDEQNLNTIYAHCSVVTGLNRAELIAELDRIAKAKGWVKQKSSA